MNKLFTAIIATVITTSLAIAQPAAFNHQHCFNAGDTSRIGFSVFNQTYESYLTQTGSAYNWDFTSAGWTAPTVQYKFQTGVERNATLFLSSGLNEYAAVTFARDQFYTYSSGNDTLYLDGISSAFAYKPSVPYLTFPLSFNDSVFVYTKQYANPVQPNNATGSISRNWIYDGFGNIQLPYGTVNNVYRIRMRQIDSTYITNATVTSDEMIWFSQQTGIPVLRFIKNATLISAYYASAEGASPTGISNASILNFSMYPNPVADIIYLNTNRRITHVTITDMQGKVLLNSEMNNDKVDVSILNQGIYMLSVLDDSGSKHTKRFVKK